MSHSQLHSVTDSRIPAGLAYHIADIYLAELERAFPAPESRTLPLNLVLQPLYTTLAIAPSKTIFARFTDNAIAPLLDDALPAPEEPKRKRRKIVSEIVKPTFPGILGAAVEGDDSEKVGRAVLKALFDEASKKETDDTNRRRMYTLCREREEGGVEL